MTQLNEMLAAQKAAEAGDDAAQKQVYGTSLGKFDSESNLFTQISSDLVKGTQRETYDDFFKFKTSIKERLSLIHI